MNDEYTAPPIESKRVVGERLHSLLEFVASQFEKTHPLRSSWFLESCEMENLTFAKIDNIEVFYLIKKKILDT